METLIARWNEIAASWWGWTWPVAWQAALVAGLVLLVLRLGRRWPAPLRYGLVLVALLKFVTPPMSPLPTGVFSRVTVGDVTTPSVEEAVARPPVARTPAKTAGPSVASSRSGSAAESKTAESWPAPSSSPVRPSTLALAFALYLLGVIVCAARLVRHAWAIRRERWLAGEPAGPFARQHEALARRLGLARVPELRISRKEGPIAIGLFSRAVLVPRALAGLREEERAAILAHELVHHRRRDLTVAWLGALVRSLWWWHPGAIALTRAARETREECCDDMVLERGLVGRETYCRSLLRAACVMGIGRTGALVAAYHEHPLGARFRRLFDEKRSHQGRLGGPAWGLLAAAALLLLPGLGRPAPGSHQAAAARELRGVVLDPGGRPVAGASVFLSKDVAGAAPRATSDAQGRFRVGLDAEQAAHKYLSVVAMAQGFGLAWEPTHDVADVQLRLAPDTAPIRGRVVDLEGRAVADAEVSVILVGIFPEGGFDAWLAGVADGTAPFDGMAEVAVQEKRLRWWQGRAPQIRATTGADGRFELRGIGADRLTRVLIEKRGFASAALGVITRDVQTIVCPARAEGGFGFVYRGASFTYPAAPAREVSGTVTDAAGRPIAGAEVSAQVPESPDQIGATGSNIRGVAPDYLHARTDAQGRYAFHNLPLDPGVTLVFDGHEVGFHLIEHELDDLRELRSQTQDAVLAPTVQVTGRVIDQAGNPVPKVNLDYYPAGGEAMMMVTWSVPHFHVQTDEQGRFMLPLPEGRGVVAARAGEEYAGASGISDEEAKELELEFNLDARSHAAVHRLDLKLGGQVPELELVLRRAPSRRIDFVDPDGKALTGVCVYDENPSSYRRSDVLEPLAEAHCEIRGELVRPIIAVHRERNLIGIAEASASGAEPLRFQLVPAGAIVGRLVDVDGVPRPRVDLDIQGSPQGTKLVERWPSMVMIGMLGVDWFHGQKLRTDDEGRFRLAPLVPGWTYSIAEEAMDVPTTDRAAPATPKTGETIDVGDVQTKKE